MTREEAIAKGVEVYDTVHSMKRRSPWHDYCQKGTYMLTLVVEGRKPLLGRLVSSPSPLGNAVTPLGNTKGTVAGTLAGTVATVPSVFPEGRLVSVERTELGKAIENEEILKINRYYPMVEVWKLCIMPDHIHMILRVKENLPKGKNLGTVVRGFKTGCSRAWWRLSLPPLGNTAYPLGNTKGTVAETVAWTEATVPSAFPEERRTVLFEPGYNDKILLHEGQLDNWKAYLDDNPRRLWMKRNNPQLFTVLHDMEVAGRKCQIVGNRFLLDIPDKVAVIVHRRYTDTENARLREEWLSCGERGGVLVSAAIAQKEKEVLREAMNRGYRIILLRENGFPQLYKPSGESFNACSAGLLLQISPWEYHMERKTITRAQCLEMNGMAEMIVGISDELISYN